MLCFCYCLADLGHFWPMNPGWGKSRHPDPGWTILSIFSFTYDFWCCSDGKKSDRDKKIQDQQPFYLLFVLPFLFLLKTWHYNYNSNICIHSEITKKKSGKINNVIVISSMTTIQGLTKDTRKPAVTCLYNVTMGGTDVVDLIMSHNSVRWKSNRWTMSTLAYLLDTAAVNSNTLSGLHPGKTKPKAREFRLELVADLVLPHMRRRLENPRIQKHIKMKAELYMGELSKCSEVTDRGVPRILPWGMNILGLPPPPQPGSGNFFHHIWDVYPGSWLLPIPDPGSKNRNKRECLKKIAHDARAVVRSGMVKNHDPG